MKTYEDCIWMDCWLGTSYKMTHRIFQPCKTSSPLTYRFRAWFVHLYQKTSENYVTRSLIWSLPICVSVKHFHQTKTKHNAQVRLCPWNWRHTWNSTQPPEKRKTEDTCAQEFSRLKTSAECIFSMVFSCILLWPLQPRFAFTFKVVIFKFPLRAMFFGGILNGATRRLHKATWGYHSAQAAYAEGVLSKNAALDQSPWEKSWNMAFFFWESVEGRKVKSSNFQLIVLWIFNPEPVAKLIRPELWRWKKWQSDNQQKLFWVKLWQESRLSFQLVMIPLVSGVKQLWAQPETVVLRSFAQQKLILEWCCDKFFWFLNSQVPHSSCFGCGTVESCACGTSCAECLLAKKNSWINLIQLAKRLRWSSVPQQAQVKINLSSSDPLRPIDAYCTYCHCFLEFPYQPTRWDLEV